MRGDLHRACPRGEGRASTTVTITKTVAPTAIWDLLLRSGSVHCDLRSGSGHCDLALLVEVRQLRTAIWRAPMLSGACC